MEELLIPVQNYKNFIQRIHTHLLKDQLTNTELDNIYLSLINCVHWSIVEMKYELRSTIPKNEKIKINEFETSRFLESKWLDRESIIYRIQNTSGLDLNYSELNLLLFEGLIYRIIASDYTPVFPSIGKLSFDENPTTTEEKQNPTYAEPVTVKQHATSKFDFSLLKTKYIKGLGLEHFFDSLRLEWVVIHEITLRDTKKSFLLSFEDFKHKLQDSLKKISTFPLKISLDKELQTDLQGTEPQSMNAYSAGHQ